MMMGSWRVGSYVGIFCSFRFRNLQRCHGAAHRRLFLVCHAHKYRLRNVSSFKWWDQRSFRIKESRWALVTVASRFACLLLGLELVLRAKLVDGRSGGRVSQQQLDKWKLEVSISHDAYWNRHTKEWSVVPVAWSRNKLARLRREYLLWEHFRQILRLVLTNLILWTSQEHSSRRKSARFSASRFVYPHLFLDRSERKQIQGHGGISRE